MILLRTFERAQEVREDSSSEWLQDASAAVNQPAPGDAALAEAKRQLRERGGELDALIKSREGARALRAALRDAELPDWMSGMRSYGHASEAAVESRLDESVPFLAAACNTSAASFKFRPQQREALRASLSGRHVVCEWPTGHGKTMAIAGPSLAAGGITLVLCPLQAMPTALVASLSNCQAVGGLRIFKLEAHHNDPKKIAAERAQLAELRGHQGAALVVATLHKASGGVPTGQPPCCRRSRISAGRDGSAASASTRSTCWPTTRLTSTGCGSHASVSPVVRPRSLYCLPSPLALFGQRFVRSLAWQTRPLTSCSSVYPAGSTGSFTM